jgi:hypothetical protein
MASASNWKSFSERCMGRLIRITEGKTAWLNGSEVFFDSVDGDGKPYSPMKLGADKAFELVYVDYISMSRVGIGSFVRAENKLLRGLEKVIEADQQNEPPADKEDGAREAITAEDAEVSLVLRSGSVLRYTAEDGSFAYSPVMKNDLKAGSKMVKEESRLLPLFSDHQQFRPNLHFVRKVGDVLGRMYGMEPLDFLDLPAIIVQTGEVCLFNISDSDSEKICLDMPIQVCMAWLMGFIGRETRLNEMHTLNRLFRSLLKSGFSSATKLGRIEEAIATAKARGSVPLVAYKPPSERMKDRAEWSMPLTSELIAV